MKHSVKLIHPPAADQRCACQPVGDHGGIVLAGFGLPAGVDFHAAAQRRGVEAIIGAQRGKIALARPRCQPQQPLDIAPHRLLPAARPEPDLARLGTAHQPAFGLLRPQLEAERSQRRQQLRIAQRRAFRFDQQIGQHLTLEQYPLAVLHRPRAGEQPGFIGEGAEQPLRKGVDGIDAQPAAGAIEHAGKQGARALLRIRAKSAPIAFSSSASAVGSSRTQPASLSLIRAAISVAPALVNVRQRICEGSTSGRSSNRNTREDST